MKHWEKCTWKFQLKNTPQPATLLKKRPWHRCKAFMKPFEAPQRSVKIKIQVNFLSSIGRRRVKKHPSPHIKKTPVMFKYICQKLAFSNQITKKSIKIQETQVLLATLHQSHGVACSVDTRWKLYIVRSEDMQNVLWTPYIYVQFTSFIQEVIVAYVQTNTISLKCLKCFWSTIDNYEKKKTNLSHTFSFQLLLSPRKMFWSIYQNWHYHNLSLKWLHRFFG